MTEYILEGNLVLVEKKGNDVIYYTYDRDGSIITQLPRKRILLYKKPIAETSEKADSPL